MKEKMQEYHLKDTKIFDMEIAQKRLIGELVNCGFQLKDIISINKNRYSILKSKNKNILFTFKRDPFYTFGDRFKDFGQEGEVGDSINQEDLDLAIRMQVTDIISVFSDGIAYTIPLFKFLEESFKWEIGEGKQVRSISLNKYKKLFDLA